MKYQIQKTQNVNIPILFVYIPTNLTQITQYSYHWQYDPLFVEGVVSNNCNNKSTNSCNLKFVFQNTTTHLFIDQFYFYIFQNKLVKKFSLFIKNAVNIHYNVNIPYVAFLNYKVYPNNGTYHTCPYNNFEFNVN